MSLTHIVSRSYRDTSGTSITSTETVTGDTEFNFDGSIAIASNVEVDWDVTRANLKSLSIYCLGALSFKTNGSGSAGAIVSTSINAAGTGYALNDTGTITGGSGGGSGGTYIITGVSGAGAVTAYTVTAAGTLYLPTAGLSPAYAATATGGGQAGSGTGFRLNLLTVVEAFSIVAGQNLMWTYAQDGLVKLPFTGNVAKLYVTNATSDSQTLKIRAMADQTP